MININFPKKEINKSYVHKYKSYARNSRNFSFIENHKNQMSFTNFYCLRSCLSSKIFSISLKLSIEENRIIK